MDFLLEATSSIEQDELLHRNILGMLPVDAATFNSFCIILLHCIFFQLDPIDSIMMLAEQASQKSPIHRYHPPLPNISCCNLK